MPTFAYVARDEQGQIQQGTIDAENDRVVVRELRESGLVVQKVNKVATKKKKKQGDGTVLKGFGKVRPRELTIFCRQFATMVNAGVTLVRCLAVLETQTESPNLKRILREVQYSVESGETLTRSLSRFPYVFTPLFLGLIRAGEVGGVLDETLERLATFLEEDLKLKRKVKAAMTYPTIVLIMAVGIVVGLVTFIVPKFMAVFKDFDIPMPAMTMFLMNCSKFMTNPAYVLLLSGTIFLSVIAVNRFKATKTGKRYWDKMMLKAPVFGPLNHNICVSRFARTLGTLLVSGVPLMQALETVAGAIDNEIISTALLDARAAIREGERLGEPLDRSKLFPAMVIQMISIGEETGALDSMLTKVAEFYEDEVDAALESLTAALEPILIVFLGAIVGFIVIAMFMPLMAIITSMSGPDA